MRKWTLGYLLARGQTPNSCGGLPSPPQVGEEAAAGLCLARSWSRSNPSSVLRAHVFRNQSPRAARFKANSSKEQTRCLLLVGKMSVTFGDLAFPGFGWLMESGVQSRNSVCAPPPQKKATTIIPHTHLKSRGPSKRRNSILNK